jgi:hypothetical protein
MRNKNLGEALKGISSEPTELAFRSMMRLPSASTLRRSLPNATSKEIVATAFVPGEDRYDSDHGAQPSVHIELNRWRIQFNYRTNAKLSRRDFQRSV